MKKVSIIIPAYNCEKTLAECLGNVLNQTLKDIEVIIVNDASTDNTWKIISDCEAQFSDLVMAINSHINRGAGGARNIGLMYATGEYIGFVDSDDIIALDMYEKLYNTAKQGNYDIVDCGYYNEEKDSAIVHTSDELTGNLDFTKRNELIVSGGYIWSKIFRREFLLESNISFRENVILEDLEYLMYLFATADRIGNVKEILYNYRYFKTSLSKFVNADKYYKNAVAAMEAVYSTMSVLPEYEKLKMSVEYVIFQLISFTTNMSLSYGKKEASFSLEDNLKELEILLKKYITIPASENKYIKNKISDKDLDILKNTYKTTIL